MQIRNPGEINGQPFDVAGCKDCTIILADYTNQVCLLHVSSRSFGLGSLCNNDQLVLAKVRLDDLENCRVFVGASSESVWMRNCKNCKVNNVVALLFVQ